MGEADQEMSTLPPWPGELDEPTLRGAQSGDDAARRALIERYERPVFALLHRMMAPAQLDRVEGVAQETFLRLLRSLAGFAPLGPARLSIWILTIAARRAIDELQRSDRAAELSAHHAQPAAARASAALGDDERAALLLRAYHRFEVADIARALACEPGSVEPRLQLARAALLRALEAVDATGENVQRGSEPFTRAEIDALAAWTAPAPLPGFADRVLAALRSAPSTSVPPAPTMESNSAAGVARNRGRIFPWVIVAAAALLALVLVQLRSPPTPSGHEAGNAAPQERRSIRFGQRAVAVVEPGSSVSWAIEPARTRVTQRAGDVFYRIEPGGTVEVETPHGTIRATAACLRIDLDARTPVAASAIVTVHEGSALLTTRDRHPHSIDAGHVALIGPQGVRTLDRRRLPPPTPDTIAN